MIRRLTPLVLLALAAGRLDAQLPEGNRAWAAGRYDEARAAYERVLQADPRSVRALYRLGVLASWRNQLDSALVLLRRARGIEPDDPDVRVSEAQVLGWQGHHDAAIARYDSVLAVDPERRDALLGRARVLAWAERYAAADSGYRLMLLNDPEDADALLGRAQLAHWNGHDGAAGAFLARALARDSSNREAQALRRELHAASGPEAEATVNWNNDSDHNTNWTEALTLSTGIAPGIRVFATGGLQRSSDPVRSASRLLAESGLQLAMGRVRLTAAAGGRELRPDALPSRSVFTYRAGAGYRPARGLDLGATFAHLPLDETALLIGGGLDIDALDGSVEARLARRLALSLGGGAAWISDGNRRVSAVAALTHTATRHLFLGAYGRLLDYEQHGVGYFSPDRFVLAEARGGYLAAGHGWEGRLSGGAGVQHTTGSSAQGEWHVEARIARRWNTLNSVELFGGVTNSVASSVNGAFRYRSAGARVLIGF